VLILGIVICVSSILVGFKSPEVINEPTTHTVTIFQMKFDPSDLTVNKGDTVVWINKDFYQHDVTETTNKKWASKPLNQGESFSKVISDDVNYFCSLHKVMTGKIEISK